ncbi:MAG: 2-oxo acid dehydrogenase subunit E2 [Candidatus Atribacteria bacterium]|nr:2-oxo acid dehydrogenase subunit E2 [Candidatus Atribacteria bacterium]MCD6349598.1 2-oxo acid dehydrogenase subunit E2 [Candidatus Atribacteria bacterium]
MAKKVIMPKLGLTMEEGVINKWLVKEGDRVEKGDPLFEVATDKVNMEVEAPASGVVLKILYPEGSTVPITKTVAYIGEEGEEIPSEEEATGEAAAEVAEKESREEAQEKPVSQKESTFTVEAKDGKRLKVSPLAKRLAMEHGIDLTTVVGTGPGGRIIKRDIEKVLAERRAKTEETVSRPATSKTVPLTRMRKIIAQRMLQSMQSKPHFFLTREVRADELVAFREKLLPLVEKRTGYRVSYTDILVKIVARVLEEFPEINAYFLDEEVQFNEQINIGIAVALDEGLVVPVLRDANRKSITSIVKEMNELVQKARKGKLLPEDLEGGTFTISNLGMFGVDSFTAIINPPQSAILACGAIRRKPYFDGKEIIPAYLWNLTLSCDHRIIDGATAAKFMSTLISFIEDPLNLIL